MAKALRTAAAERDFEQIGWQIAVGEERPETARRILTGLAQACDELATLAPTSRLGTAANELGTGV